MTVAAVATTTTPAAAHGQPIDGLESRNSYCTQTASRPYLNKDNPACARAYEGPEGDQPGYDPFESNQANGSSFSSNGQVAPLIKDIIPDGQLCGAGRDKYAGFNTPTSAWPYRAYEPGTSITYKYTAWAHHPGQIDLYVSKAGFDPTTQALGWDDLESQPLATISTDVVNGQSAEYNSPTYEQQITLPNRTGRMVVASIWRRSDSPEVFYYCSDLVLEAGANGEIYNLGAVEGGVAPPSTAGPQPQDQPDPPEESTTSTTATTSTGDAAETAAADTTTTDTTAATIADVAQEPQTEVAGQVVLVPGDAAIAAPTDQPALAPVVPAGETASGVSAVGVAAEGQSSFSWATFFLGGIFALLMGLVMVLAIVIVVSRRTGLLERLTSRL